MGDHMRKNILILGHSYVVPFIEINNQYAKAFPSDQYHVTIAYLTGKPPENSVNPPNCDQLLFLQFPKSALRGLKLGAIRRLLTLCQSNRYEIVICQRYKASYIMQWVAQFIAIPKIIFVMHAIGTMNSFSRRLLAAILQRNNMFYAGVSNAVRDDLRNHLWRVPQDKIIILYNVLDVPLVEAALYSRSEARLLLSLPEDIFIFGHVGRLEANKDQKTLLRAFAACHTKHPHSRLVVMGDGVLRDDLHRLANELAITSAVIFTGFVTDGYRYMRAFDCFVLTSKQEAFGRVLLEAMIAEVPVVATGVFGIPEVVGDVGSLVKVGNVAAIAGAMEKIIDMDFAERKKIGMLGRKRVNTLFSMDAFRQQISHFL